MRKLLVGLAALAALLLPATIWAAQEESGAVPSYRVPAGVAPG